MIKTRRMAILTALILTMLITPINAFAHSQNCYDVCPIENCLKTSVHTHKSNIYAAHCLNDGHEYHQFCIVQNCTKTTIHEHDGITYFAHHATGGHNYRNAGQGNGHKNRNHH